MSRRASTPHTLYGIDLGLSLSERRVMVADESAFSCRTMTRFLNWAGIDQVACVANGDEVLSRIELFNPDLLLLDTQLAGTDGITVLKRLRAHPRYRDLPILMQSAVPSDHLRTRCFQAGATDIIAKPINPGECVARVRYHLERRTLVEELKTFRSRIERDLRQARDMQLGLVPEPSVIEDLARAHGLVVDSLFRSSDEIGGDFWTTFALNDHQVGLFVADLSGHGIAAAINAFRLHTLLFRSTHAELDDPARLLALLNARLHEILPVGQFATAFYGVIDHRAGTLRYASAGAPNPIYGDRDGFRALDGSGMFLGAFSDASYDMMEIPFPCGASLLLYSDGLIEACDERDEMLGEDGLLAMLDEAVATDRWRPVRGMMSRFMPRFGDSLSDDLTVVWVNRL